MTNTEPLPDVTDRPVLAGPAAAEGLTALFDRHAADLRRYLARRLDPATADDLVAETFLIAWRQRASYRPDRGTARAWLYGIATNLARRHVRAEVRRLRATAALGGRAGPSGGHADDHIGLVADRVDAATVVRGLAAGLAALRPIDRDVLLLVAWAGLAPVEVAEVVGEPVGTVRSRLHRVRGSLRGMGR